MSEVTKVYFARYAQPELDFDGDKLLSIKEHCHIEKEFKTAMT